MPESVGPPDLADWLWSQRRREWFRTMTTEMRRHQTCEELYTSEFWRENGEEILSLLTTIQSGSCASSSRSDDAGGNLRIVHWNILKGIALDQITTRLLNHPELREADVLLLNEADLGMARSRNHHVAERLAEHLGLHWAFVPNYLELTKGPDEEAQAPGDNHVGLHGVAILSRRKPLALHACQLPECFDMFTFEEKRFGWRTALLAALEGGLLVGSVHLEVRGMPRCRAQQMATLLGEVDAFADHRARLGHPVQRILLGGDLNSHTFPRGTLLHGVRGLLRILGNRKAPLARQMMEPWLRNREPLFEELRQRGYAWMHLNDRRPTASEVLGRVEESGLLLPILKRLLLSGLRLGHRRIPLRLDWFAGRGIEPAPDGLTPRAVGEMPLGTIPSDHLPLVIEIPR